MSNVAGTGADMFDQNERGPLIGAMAMVGHLGPMLGKEIPCQSLTTVSFD